MKQTITPTPIIPATGGWCLQYVRQAFGLPAKYASATEAWEQSTSKHRDRNFPAGLWVPVWYGIDVEPLGHVVLLAPDGSCYSTSDYSGWPVHHASLEALEEFYAKYGMILQYRGWTEDVASYTVIEPTTTNKGLFVTLKQEDENLILDRNKKYIDAPTSKVDEAVWGTVIKRTSGNNSALQELADCKTLLMSQRAVLDGVLNALNQLAKGQGTPVDLEAVRKAAEAGAASALSDLNAVVSFEKAGVTS